MVKFSIITPVNLWQKERLKKFEKTIDSIENQTNHNFEWIVVDDGSTLPLDPFWKKLEAKGARVIHVEHGERVTAANEGFKKAIGEWFCVLDSDDEYSKDYLEEVDNMISDFPKERMFNFGCIYHNPDGTETKRKAFRPKRKKVGHEVFGGGNIVKGTYVFHRSIYDTIGAYPAAVIKDIDCGEINYSKGPRDLYMGTPYDFSAMAQMEFPELRELFMVPDTDPAKEWKIIKELGNPWGDDFYLFFKMTRKYHSKPVDKYLYIVHPKKMGER